MWNKKTEGSRALRAMMSKFTAYDSSISEMAWGSPYTGEETRPLTREEELVRATIESRSMSVHRARRILDGISTSTPFVTRVEFIECVAALVACYPHEVQKVAKGANRALYKILHSATASGRLEWYFNNTRQRYSMSTGKLSLLASGTTSNESLHAEINGWFRSTVAMHQDFLW